MAYASPPPERPPADALTSYDLSLAPLCLGEDHTAPSLVSSSPRLTSFRKGSWSAILALGVCLAFLPFVSLCDLPFELGQEPMNPGCSLALQLWV
jgi:hypothetical protein